jgi:hypothetical protein
MSTSNYTLEIISHHSQFKNKSLRQYYVDGINTVGAWGDEPFEIRFKNNTWQKVQVKISLDGTDVLTGKPATTDVSKDMWVVNGYGTLNLKAWPETNNGGASFVFTSANNSVAVHTHGDLSSRGIIAAAVYVEGHVEPISIPTPVRIVEEHHHHYPRYRHYWDSVTSPYYIGGVILNNSTLGGGGTFSSNTISTADMTKGVASNSVDCFNLCDASPASAESKSLENLVSVGAGQHVDQKITYVTGLTKPVFTETVRVRYLWWDDLVTKLREANVPAPHASGFPGDRNQGIMSIGNTPRMGGSFRRSEPSPMAYSRV